MVEENFRRAMILARGDSLALFQRPVAGTLLVITAVVVVLISWAAFRRRPPTAEVETN